MRKKNKVVRVKRTFNSHDKERQYQDYIFMTYGDYCESKEYVFLGEKTELYPYRWFDVRLLWMKMSYRLKKKPITFSPNKVKEWLDVIHKTIKLFWKMILLTIM